MAITAYKDFVDTLGDIVIAGVITRLDAPPRNIETADLPASYPSAVMGQVLSEDFMTVGTPGGWPNLTAQLFIILEPTEQEQHPVNHAAALTIIDAATTALRGLSYGTLGKGHVGWSIDLTSSLIVGGDISRRFWALVITVEGEG